MHLNHALHRYPVNIVHPGYHQEFQTMQLASGGTAVGAGTPKVFYQTVSDHLPVMFRVRSSGPDDD